jgi:hypothetical protein
MRRQSRSRKTVEELSVGGLETSELLRLGAFDAPCTCGPSYCWPSIAQIHVYRYQLEVHLRAVQEPRRIRVSWTSCHFGGQRPWLHCPCGRRVGKLLPGLGGFYCRECMGSPLYASQSTSTGGRKHFAAAKLRLRLGGMASPADPQPTRPKRMHETTFARHKAKLDTLEAELSPRLKARTPDYKNLVIAARI